MGRARVPAWGTALVVVATLGAGCGSGAAAPPFPRAPVTTGAPGSPTTVPTPTASASGICSAPDTLTALSVTRTDAFPHNHISFVFPVRVASTKAAAIAAVARAACQLEDFPPGAMSCPAALGISYALVFTAGTVVFGTVTTEPTGCPTLTGLGPPRWAGPSFWDRLAAALGLLAPWEYCDPFRGRLPTSPSQCGPKL